MISQLDRYRLKPTGPVHAFHTELKNSEAFLPGVMSRKKQVVPLLSALWG